MTLDHPMDKEDCILFLLIVPDTMDQEVRNSTLRGLSLGHKLLWVDLSE